MNKKQQQQQQRPNRAMKKVYVGFNLRRRGLSASPANTVEGKKIIFKKKHTQAKNRQCFTAFFVHEKKIKK